MFAFYLHPTGEKLKNNQIAIYTTNSGTYDDESVLKQWQERGEVLWSLALGARS